MYNSNRGSVSSHYDSKVESHSGYRRANRDDEADGDYRRSKDSTGRRRNRWDDDERNSASSKEYRRPWKERSRSPATEKQKSPSVRVRKDLFENEVKKSEEISSKKRTNNWSDSSDEESYSNQRRRRNPPADVNGSNGSHHRINDSFPAVSTRNSGNEYIHSKQEDFQRNVSSNNGYQSSGISSESKPLTNLKTPMELGVRNASSGIQIRLLPSVKAASSVTSAVAKPKPAMKVSSVFNVDDDDEEEMPAECKMRMKNIGRETPTSAGPNSFGKTKIGFCNMATIKERRLQDDILKKK